MAAKMRKTQQNSINMYACHCLPCNTTHDKQEQGEEKKLDVTCELGTAAEKLRGRKSVKSRAVRHCCGLTVMHLACQHEWSGGLQIQGCIYYGCMHSVRTVGGFGASFSTPADCSDTYERALQILARVFKQLS